MLDAVTRVKKRDEVKTSRRVIVGARTRVNPLTFRAFILTQIINTLPRLYVNVRAIKFNMKLTNLL